MGGKSASDVCFMEDRFSELPDEIICDILSRLDYTVDAVRTSVLSKRWRLLWTSVPVIVLQGDTTRAQFVEFVDKVLTLNQVSSLEQFKFNCWYSPKVSRFLKWITDVSLRNVEILELKYYQEDLNEIELPLNFYTNKKLRRLRLGGHIVLNVTCVVYLPSLKTIHLDLRSKLDGDSVKKLIDGCPVLQGLKILEIDSRMMTTLHIKSHSLKRLQLQTTYDSDVLSCIVDATKLEEIDLHMRMPQQFKASNFPSLVKTNLLFERASVMSNAYYRDTTTEILRTMSDTNRLSLAVYGTTFLGYTKPWSFPKFRNLAHLELQIHDSCVLMWSYILECSPNLISICLDLDPDTVAKKRVKYRHKTQCNQKFRVPRCNKLKLEMIKISGFRGCNHEMQMVSYFLINSPVLKETHVESKFRDAISWVAKDSGTNSKIYYR